MSDNLWERAKEAMRAVLSDWQGNEIAPHYSADHNAIMEDFERLRILLSQMERVECVEGCAPGEALFFPAPAEHAHERPALLLRLPTTEAPE